MPIIIGDNSFPVLWAKKIISCSELEFKDTHLTDYVSLSEVGENALDTIAQSLVGAINEILGAVIAEDLWDRLGTLIHPKIAGDDVATTGTIAAGTLTATAQQTVNGIGNCSAGGLSAGWIDNSLSWGHDPAGHTSWFQSGGVAGTDLLLNPQGGTVNIGGVPLTHTDGSVGDVGCQRFECNGILWADTGVIVGNNQVIAGGSAANYGGIYSRITGQTNDAQAIGVGLLNNYFFVCQVADVSFDFQHPIYLDPTQVWHSRNQSISEYVAKQHNSDDAKEIVGTGSNVSEHIIPVELADDAEFSLPDATAGYGHAIVGDGEEDVYFIWTSAAAVILRSNSANVANTDSDTDFCVYPSGTQIFIKNRLGASKKILFDYHFWTP